MKKYSIAAIFVSLSLLYGCALESDCSSDEKRCIEVDETAYIETCNDGLWQRESNACASGLCDDNGNACLQTDCAPNDTHCDKDYGIKTCDKHGQWSEYTPCEAGLGCKYDGKSCAECNANDIYCDGNVLKMCLEGILKDIPDVSNYCNTCIDGNSICDGTDKYKTCQNSVWSDTILCKDGETCSDGKCTTSGCKIGEKICSDGKLSTCEDGKWSAQLTCPYNNCKSATECGECRNDSKTCINNHNYGELQVCINGTLTPMSCSASCNATNNDCGTCITGNTKCSNNKQQTCVSGEWSAETPCEFGCDGVVCASITVPKADILDVVFQPDGTAINEAPDGLEVKTGSIGGVVKTTVTSYDEKVGRNVGLFTGDNFYNVSYKDRPDVMDNMKKGHSLEVVFAVSTTSSVLSKPLASHQGGGTGIEIGIDPKLKNEVVDIIFVPYVTNGYRYAQSGVTPEIDKYYHVVGTWDNASHMAYIYVDGELKGSTEASDSLKFPTKDIDKWFGIGADSGNEAFFKGKIAIARIYSNALSADEVKRLYNNSGLANTQ